MESIAETVRVRSRFVEDHPESPHLSPTACCLYRCATRSPPSPCAGPAKAGAGWRSGPRARRAGRGSRRAGARGAILCRRRRRWEGRRSQCRWRGLRATAGSAWAASWGTRRSCVEGSNASASRDARSLHREEAHRRSKNRLDMVQRGESDGEIGHRVRPAQHHPSRDPRGSVAEHRRYWVTALLEYKGGNE